MRFRSGFAPGAIPEVMTLLSSDPSKATSKTPESPLWDRRFLFLVEPNRSDLLADSPEDREATLAVVGVGTPLQTLAVLNVGLVLAEDGVTGIPESTPILRIQNARAVVAALVRSLQHDIHREVPFAAGAGNRIHHSAVVEGVLEGDVTVEAGVIVSAGAYIGRGARLEANAVIREHVTIGANTVIQAGVVVGASGFGFYADTVGSEKQDGNRLRPMPHLAGVRIGTNCWIGANTVIAAGVLHATEIGDGCKLDSHVQIAHNVRIGSGALMASQSGIAGSTVIGKNFRMGGAASVAGHLRIGDHVSVAAKSGVTKDVSDGITVAGFPARPIAQWRREMAALARLGRSEP